MSFYRTFIAVVATMGLATSVFAADEVASKNLAENTQAQEAPAAAAADQAKVNLNTATAKELMKIKGLSGAKAKAIVSYRKKHGDFKTLEALKEVKSLKKMNEKNMQAVQDQLTI